MRECEPEYSLAPLLIDLFKGNKLQPIPLGEAPAERGTARATSRESRNFQSPIKLLLQPTTADSVTVIALSTTTGTPICLLAYDEATMSLIEIPIEGDGACLHHADKVFRIGKGQHGMQYPDGVDRSQCLVEWKPPKIEARVSPDTPRGGIRALLKRVGVAQGKKGDDLIFRMPGRSVWVTIKDYNSTHGTRVFQMIGRTN